MTNLRYFSIFAVIMFSLACGMQAPAIRSESAVSVYERTSANAETSTQVKMTVTADALNVRECAGMDCAVIGQLSHGEVVVCTEFDTPQDGVYQWCKHSTGWSSTQYMEAE